MASHLSAQHARYSHSNPQNSREEDALRLPSIKDLGFRYPSRRAQDPQDLSSHPSQASIAPADTSISRDVQDNSARWARSSIQVQSPVSVSTHLQQHQPQHHHHHQQLTPPLSAGHEPSQPKNEYSSKPDGPFMTPGLPLSAQSTPVHGSVTIGPGTRGDDSDQSKRRRSSINMGTPRDQRSSHTAYPPHYAHYPPSQPPQQPYQMQPPMSHSAPSVQSPIDHVAAQQVAPPPSHPAYSSYPPQYPPHPHPHHPPSRIPLHPAPQQQQVPPTGNPYPAAPVAPPHPAAPVAPPHPAAPVAHPHSPWEQPHHPQPPPHQHQHPPPPPPAHLPPPQHVPQIQQPSHPMPHHPMPQHPQPPPPPPPLLPQHHHMHPQQHHSQQPAIAPAPPLAHTQPQSHQPPPPQIQQPQIPYARTTPIVPIDTRGQYQVPDERFPVTVRDSTMNEIMKHCQVLFDFASRYAQIQQSIPDVSPSPDEIQQMSHLAAEVVRLLEQYRRLNLPEHDRVKMDSAMAMTPPDDHRPPKRPWEDMSQDENSGLVESTAFAEQQYPTPAENKLQSTAEQDMETIRTKRATAGGSGTTTQPKSKYRKRSRATPPGKCHSCNIRETPEWRRGPDGARTLCNACGLHYAKLQRKREKQAGPNGEALPRIDMDTLRQSARAAESEKIHSRSKNERSRQSNESTSPMEPGKPLPQQHHQGSFQLVPMVVTQDPASAPPAPPPPPPPPPPPSQQQQQSTLGSAPTPPWQTSVIQPSPTVRAYAPDQLQHQSFLRTSHQATNHTSAR